MSQETELKLSLPRKAVAALRRHPLFATAVPQGKPGTLENVYYDTPELALKAQRVAVRTRRQGRDWLQTVKCATDSVGGLSSRPEWEQAYGEGFDFSAVDVPKVRKLLERHAPALAPVFSTRFRRETRLHEADDGVRVLMMLDTGEILADERREPICELELELVSGKPLDLLLLACRLAADIPLLPSDLSKAERGFRLRDATPLEPVRGGESRIDPAQTPVDAFRVLAFSCLRQWQANAAGATASDDPEFIHQLRVALRRLRSLLRIFAPALPAGFVADWGERLRQNAGHFGEARDLDVLYDDVLSPVLAAGAGEDPAIARLLAIVREARDAARRAGARKLDPAEQGRLLIGFTAALHALRADDLNEAADLRKFAKLQLSRLRKRVRRRHEAASDLVPTRLHALRIALKRLRYGLEFFLPLLPAKAGKRYLDGIVRAQNALGFINDVDVARGRLRQWAADDADLRAAASFVCGWHGPRYARLSRRAILDLEPVLWGRAPWSG